MSCRWKKRESALRLVRIRRLRKTATISTKVKSGCSVTTAKTRLAIFSRGDTLPPRAFGAALFLWRHRCSHFTAVLTLTSKRSAASRRDAPISTASMMRSLRSPEQAFGIASPRKGESMPTDFSPVTSWESLRFKSVGNRFSAVDLKFRSVVPRAHHRNFKSKNRTRIIKLLVHLLIPKFAREDAAK